MGVIKHSVVQMCHVQHVVEPVNLNWCHPAFILLPHWHVALSKDMKGTSYFLLPTSACPKIQVHFLLLEGYNLLVAISLSRGGFSRWCCCHIARGALQGHERHFLLIRHVPKFIDSYHIVAWRFFKIQKILTDWAGTQYSIGEFRFKICVNNFPKKFWACSWHDLHARE